MLKSLSESEAFCFGLYLHLSRKERSINYMTALPQPRPKGESDEMHFECGVNYLEVHGVLVCPSCGSIAVNSLVEVDTPSITNLTE